MATNFGLVAHTTERNSIELAVKGFSDRFAQGGLAHTRWSIEAEDGALVIFSKLAHSQELYDPLLDLIQAVMIPVQDYLCLGGIEVLLLTRVPRQIGDSLQVIQADVVLLIAWPELLELLELPHRDLLRLLGQLQLFQLRLHLVDFILFFLRLPAIRQTLAIFDLLLERL